ncbi:auxin-binding protein ABP19a-like [Trifolium pratense]|uniref:auxin-binding protein ABP19a-like n=1 Tax=Trifolium pratense TaxID=57577 RepID=UPI001E6940A8|nr:auxin-binding protein ABP19a-like [Trifolium pratense]
MPCAVAPSNTVPYGTLLNGTIPMHVHPDESELLMMVQGKVTAGFVTSVAMHVHPDESELLMMVQGKVTAGFVTTEKSYVKDIKVGDVFVFPKGQMHFLINSGAETAIAIAFVASSSSTLTFQFLDYILFGKSNLPTSIIAKTTLLTLI